MLECSVLNIVIRMPLESIIRNNDLRAGGIPTVGTKTRNLLRVVCYFYSKTRKLLRVV